MPEPVQTIELNGRLFAVWHCESCNELQWCAPVVCTVDTTHEHRCCPRCTEFLATGYDRTRGGWVSRRCPPVVTPEEIEARDALHALQEMGRE